MSTVSAPVHATRLRESAERCDTKATEQQAKADAARTPQGKAERQELADEYRALAADYREQLAELEAADDWQEPNPGAACEGPCCR